MKLDLYCWHLLSLLYVNLRESLGHISGGIYSVQWSNKYEVVEDILNITFSYVKLLTNNSLWHRVRRRRQPPPQPPPAPRCRRLRRQPPPSPRRRRCLPNSASRTLRSRGRLQMNRLVFFSDCPYTPAVIGCYDNFIIKIGSLYAVIAYLKLE